MSRGLHINQRFLNTKIPKARLEFFALFRIQCCQQEYRNQKRLLSACVFCFFHRLQMCISGLQKNHSVQKTILGEHTKAD